MHEKPRRRISKYLWLLVAVLFVGILLQNQAIADWWKLRDYHAPAEVSALANDTTMTAEATRLFFLNHPDIANKDEFSKHCPSGGEKTIVLGCYIGHERGIYVLSIADKRLQGVEQVTAAHEMLHAAYERLSSGNRKHVDDLLEDYYKHDLKDQRIKDILKGYETSEPGQQLNEMHSIFGTEIAKLSAGLEDYYKQYFGDRSKVAAYAANYQAAFTTRQAQVKKDDAQLAAWQTEINNDEAELKSQQAELEAEQKQLNAYRASRDTERYNALVPDYNAKATAFNALLEETKSLIVEYNQLVKARNAIAVEETQLQKALSGSLTPIGK